jgi:hypothetical protein
MDFKRCGESDCGFHVPTTYPFSKCPWHLAPGRSAGEKALVAAGAFVVFAAGYGVAKGIEAFRARRRRAEIRRGQDEWRQKRPAAGATAVPDAPPDAESPLTKVDRAGGAT